MKTRVLGTALLASSLLVGCPVLPPAPASADREVHEARRDERSDRSETRERPSAEFAPLGRRDALRPR
jgi:hypothetical protein